MISFNDNHKIVNASIIVDGKTIPLLEKPQGDSGQPRCHFYEYSSEDFKIVLRLDWYDLDENGDPKLDADVYKGGKEYKAGRKQWHHTQKIIENGVYLYIWKPDNKELHQLSVEFMLQTTHQQTITGMARIVAADNTVKISKKEIERQQKILNELVDAKRSK